jgi:hypothetical protein
MNIGNTPEERREFWGTTPASVMACTGFLIGIAGAFLIVTHTAFAGISVIGIVLLALGIKSDLRKGFAVRWRKANFMFHVTFLVLAILCTAAALVVKVFEGRRLGWLQQPDGAVTHESARSAAP